MPLEEGRMQRFVAALLAADGALADRWALTGWKCWHRRRCSRR